MGTMSLTNRIYIIYELLQYIQYKLWIYKMYTIFGKLIFLIINTFSFTIKMYRWPDLNFKTLGRNE